MREVQIKNHFKSIRMFRIKKLLNIGKDGENWIGTFIHCWFESKMVQQLQKSLSVPQLD